MLHLKALRCVLVGVVLFGAARSHSAHAQTATRTEAERDRRLEWFREARFGLFVHWGLYAVPAGEWKGKPVPGIGEWIMSRARIPVAEYEQLTKQFNPAEFDDASARAALGPFPVTALAEGVRATVERFARLQSEGRLDTGDLDS